MRVLLFPLDLFRFTYHCWLYTFGMINYRWQCGHEDQPCVFCRGAQVGVVPRPMQHRIKYRNLWMARLLNPEIVMEMNQRTGKPAPVCMREGGYVVAAPWIPVAAVVLGAAWILALCAGAWYSNFIPLEVRQQLVVHWSHAGP